MADAWFQQTTNGANTWAEIEGQAARVAIVTCDSTVTVAAGRVVTGTASISSVSSVVISDDGVISGGGLLNVNSATKSVALTVAVNVALATTSNRPKTVSVIHDSATAAVGNRYVPAGTSGVVAVSSVASVAIDKTTHRVVTAATSVVSRALVNPSSGVYPSIPQMVGSVRESVSGQVVSRALSGKPRFRNFYTRPRHVFKIAHECDDTDKQLIEAHYASDRMKAFAFTFTSDSTNYIAMYAGTPKCTPIEGEDRWRVETVLVEQ